MELPIDNDPYVHTSDITKISPMPNPNGVSAVQEEIKGKLKTMLEVSNPTVVKSETAVVNILPTSIYNSGDELDVTHRSVFLPAPAGALNTIVISHPYLWKLYKRLRSLDWDSNEFDHTRSKGEFNTASEGDIYKIVMTIIWQWETDSTASRIITDIVCAFWPGTELAALAQRIAENESLHSHSYSEIVKQCFENYQEMIDKIKNEIEPMRRLANVANLFKKCLDVANRFRIGDPTLTEDEIRTAKLSFFGGMIIMERLQFTSSFGVTFTFGDRGSWNSIAKTVQKIAVDELSVHVRTWKYCFRNESRLPEYQNVLPEVMHSLRGVLNDVLGSELSYCDLIFKNGPSISHKSKVPVTGTVLKEFVRFSAQNAMDFFGFELPFTRIETNPLPLVDKWIDINAVQTSPQEELTGNYLLGGFKKDLVDGEEYIPSFLRPHKELSSMATFSAVE